MKRKIPVALALFLMVCSIGSAAFSFEVPRQCPQLTPDLQQQVQRVLASKPGDLFVVLKNGMTVLIRQKPEDDVVSTQVFVRAGSIYEGKYLTAGLSHYLEHVLSGGTTRSFTEAEAKERLQQMGGITNAYTSHDRTVYYINTSAGHWKDALGLLTSYVTENVLDPQEVAREKSVIQQEYKLGENDINRELWKLFLKTAYQSNPVRNPVIGHEEVFIKQNRDALEDYFTSRYQPENMVLVVVGNVPPTEVLRFVAEKTKDFSRKADEPAVLPPEPPQTSPRWAEEELPLARLYQVMIGFPSVTMHDKDLYSLDVLAFLLGEGQTCRLYCRLKDEEGQVLSVGASNWTPSFTNGQFIVSLNLAPQFWPDVLENMEQEINRFKTETIPAGELEKAKKSTIAQHVFGQETVSAQASSLGSSYFDTGDPYFDETYVEGIRSVTPEEVRSVAQRYLDMNRSTVAVIKPAQKQQGPAESPEIACAPPQAAPVAFNKLDNGLKVLLKEDNSLPLVTINLYGLGGLLLEDPGQPGISAFTSSLLTAGTEQRSKLDILRAIEEVGGNIESKSDNSTYHVSIKVLKDDLDMALDILSDIVRNSEMPKDEIEKKRQEILLAIQRMDENWQAETMRLFKKNYFKDSPYEHDRLGTEESVKAFTRDDLLNSYRRMVNPTHSVLAVYGDIDRDEMLNKIRNRFGAWTGQPVALPQFPNETRQLASSRTVEKKNEKTSAALFVGTNGLDFDSTDRPALDVLNAVLAGASYPGGRLFEALRGKEDLVYLVGAFPFYGKNAGYFGVISQTTMGNLEKVQGIVLAHLKQLADEPVPEKELNTAKDMILTSHHMEMESIGAKAQSAAVNEILGVGWNYDERYPELIRSVKAEDVQRLARNLFGNTMIVRTVPEHPVEILAHPEGGDVKGGHKHEAGRLGS